MYEKILVPLDGSDVSEAILEDVETIASGCRTPDVILLRQATYRTPEVILLRVKQSLDADVKGMLDTHIARDLEETYEDDARKYLDKIAGRMVKKGLTVKTEVLAGNPAEKIIEYSRRNGIDLIIMSTHGRSGVSRLVFGSVAEKVIRQSDVPVLIKPAAGK